MCFALSLLTTFKRRVTFLGTNKNDLKYTCKMNKLSENVNTLRGFPGSSCFFSFLHALHGLFGFLYLFIFNAEKLYDMSYC
jgi:hypothetical protein